MANQRRLNSEGSMNLGAPHPVVILMLLLFTYVELSVYVYGSCCRLSRMHQRIHTKLQALQVSFSQ
jgi:hypothetical protein